VVAIRGFSLARLTTAARVFALAMRLLSPGLFAVIATSRHNSHAIEYTLRFSSSRQHVPSQQNH
jgi:hypothetical protein